MENLTGFSEEQRSGWQEGILEGWMSGGMEVWRFKEERRTECQKGKPFNNSSSIDEISQQPLTETNHSTVQPFYHSTDNGYTSIHPYLYTSKKAFTLAEVLITLAVVGVIASMTLPTLVQNYQKKVFGMRAKAAYTRLYQAIKMSEAENGEISEWDFDFSSNNETNTKLFIEKYLKPYIKEMKYCDTGNTSGKCAKYVGCGGAGVNYYLPNGNMLGVCAYLNSDNVSFTIGLNKNPKKMRRNFYCVIDRRTKYFGVAHFNSNIFRTDILNGYTSPTHGYNVICSKTGKTDYYNYACPALLYLDNFEVKDDYPW